MAQDDFSGTLNVEKRNRLKTRLEQLKNQFNIHRSSQRTQQTKKAQDLYIKKFNALQTEIAKLEQVLGVDPSKFNTPTKDQLSKGLSLSGSRPRPNIPSSRTATETSSQKNTNSEVKSKPPAGGKPNNREKLINLKGTFNTNKTTDENMPIPKPRPNISESKNYSPRIQKMLEDQERQSLRRSANFQDEALSQDSLQAPSRQRLEDNIKNVDDDQDMNALEKLVSRIVGKNIRFEDIPEDDPFITDMPQNYQNLRRGGQVKRMGHGGAITPEQKKRISRIVQENKARKSKSTKATPTPTATSSKKRAAPFSDMKKARMNGNKKELTDRQEVFLDCLFDEANGNLREAMRIAGYSANTKTSSVLRTLQDQIIDRTQMYLAANGPMAAMAMTGVLTDPTALGNRDRIAASREILDRTGIVKTERITVKTDAPSLLIFPPKSEPTYDEDDDDDALRRN